MLNGWRVLRLLRFTWADLQQRPEVVERQIREGIRRSRAASRW